MNLRFDIDSPEYFKAQAPPAWFLVASAFSWCCGTRCLFHIQHIEAVWFSIIIISIALIISDLDIPFRLFYWFYWAYVVVIASSQHPELWHKSPDSNICWLEYLKQITFSRFGVYNIWFGFDLHALLIWFGFDLQTCWFDLWFEKKANQWLVFF